MQSASKQDSCAARLPEHRDSRLQDFRDFAALLDGDLNGPGPELDAALERTGIDLEGSEYPDDDIRDAVYQYPLGVSVYRMVRIDISTGGPAEWLEITLDAENEPTRIEFHFADWFDHASQTLEDDDFAAAERFARELTADFDGLVA